jgi:hypothetical protein
VPERELSTGRDLHDLAHGHVQADPLADLDRVGEADLVDAVVELGARSLQPEDLGAEPRDQRQGEEAVRDGAPERAGCGALEVHVDPLVVAGGVGELVDPLLGDLDPLAGAELLAGRLGQLLERGEHAHPDRSSSATFGWMA